jgi:secondary thiamine-phosphate synthase enzyme
MKIYNEHVTLQSKKPREVFNITTQVKAAMEKSGFRDGVILVSSLHSNSGVIVNEQEPRFLQVLDNWLHQLAPSQEDSQNQERPESDAGDAAFHLQSLLLHHQVMVSFTETRLDLGLGQAVLFVELDGLRPRRIVVKVMGE